MIFAYRRIFPQAIPWLTSLVLSAALTSVPVVVLAQSSTGSSSIVQVSNEPVQLPLRAAIAGPEDTPVGRTIILDASQSHEVGTDIEYLWYVNDGAEPVSKRVDVIYTPEKTGELRFRLVMRASVNGQRQESIASRTVIVYSRKMLLIADRSVPDAKVDYHFKLASDAGLYLKVLRPSQSIEERGGEDAFVRLLQERSDTIAGADAIILWMDGVVGLQSLMRVVEGQPQLLAAMQNQSIVIITEGSAKTVARTARGPYSVLQPRQIAITHPESLALLLTAKDMPAFLEQAKSRDAEVVVIDASSLKIRPWNLLTLLVNYMLVQGVSSQTIVLLLMLPIIATLLSFLKQVIGITTFGLFAPSIIALSFLALGWWVGLLFLAFIVSTGYATRSVMRKWHLLYIPKMAIILAVGSITLLLLLGIGASFGILLSRDAVFILLIMSTLSESFLNAKTEQGWMSAMMGIGQTVLAALLCVFVVQWSFLQSLILAYPELILLTIIFNVFLGKWTGLRLIEYLRFRELFQHMRSEES